MTNPLEHWLMCLTGQIKAPKTKGNRRYVSGLFVRPDDAASEVIHKLIASEVGGLCAMEVQEFSGYRKTTVYRVLDKMLAQGLIETEMRVTSTSSGRVLKHYKIKERNK